MALEQALEYALTDNAFGRGATMSRTESPELNSAPKETFGG